MTKHLIGTFVLFITTQQIADGATTAEVFDGYVCLKCHHTSTMDVGPSFQMIAARYKNDSLATEKLINVVLNGGVGNWGQTIPMPPIRSVDRSQANTFVKWILLEAPQGKHGELETFKITKVLNIAMLSVGVLVLAMVVLLMKRIRPFR